MRLRLCVPLVDDVLIGQLLKTNASDWSQGYLAHVLRQDLVEDVVDGEREAGLVLEQLLHQQRVKIVRVHHIVPEITSIINCLVKRIVNAQ